MILYFFIFTKEYKTCNNYKTGLLYNLFQNYEFIHFEICLEVELKLVFTQSLIRNGTWWKWEDTGITLGLRR